MSVLTLSGWTQPSDVLLPLAEGAAVFDYSDYPAPEASFDGLARFRDVRHVIAWSMGGQLAVRAIAAGVLKPRHLTLIAAPYRFVSDSAAGEAMDPLTFEQFRTNYAQQPARTKGRFHGLVAKGDRDFARVLGLLGHHPQVEDTNRWLPWLDELGRYTVPDDALAALPPTLVVHGMNDAIVPFAQGQLLAGKIPQAELRAWEGVAHAPHVHDTARLKAEIADHRATHGVA